MLQLEQHSHRDQRKAAFRFMTPRVRVDETHLTESMLLSRSFHLVCNPDRCIDLVNGIRVKRKAICLEKHCDVPEPYFIWEPMPDSCTPNMLESILRATQHVDVISPNHTELAALFAETGSVRTPNTQEVLMEIWCRDLLSRGFDNNNGIVVVRCGRKGCYIRSRGERKMVPAYHDSKSGATKAVDPTGAGNTFLGGFSIGMISKPLPGLSQLETAAIHGTVAASFAIEQVGLPELSTNGEQELWNGQEVQLRLNELACIIRV